MMTLLRAILAELLGLFVDDGALALALAALVALVTVAVRLLGLDPLAASLLLALGAFVALGLSLWRAVAARRR